jgi:hypothetical protein
LIYRRLIRAAFEKKLLGGMSEAELERWVKAVSSHSIRLAWRRTISPPARACRRSCRPIAGGTPRRSCATVRGSRQERGVGAPRAALSGEPLSDGQDQCDRTIQAGAPPAGS